MGDPGQAMDIARREVAKERISKGSNPDDPGGEVGLWARALAALGRIGDILRAYEATVETAPRGPAR